MSATRASRQLHEYMAGDGNWRLKGLFLAGLHSTRVSEDDVAKAWPINSSDYRALSESNRNHPAYSPEQHLSMPEHSEGYRMLSDATKESDWDEGPLGQPVIHRDRAIKRALAFSDTIEELDTLWRKELLDTVIAGARKRQVARDAANVINVETKSGDHPRASDDIFASDVAEGAAIRDSSEDPDTVSWSSTKFGQGARATEELIDHALVDVIEREVERLGRACENKINRIFLNELLDNVDSNNDVDASSQGNKGLDSMVEAIKEIENNDFMPDAAVIHPEFTRALFDTNESGDNLLFANQAGADNALRDQVAFPLLGLTGYKLSDGVANGSTTWGYSAASEFGCVVYQQEMISLYMYRDIEIKNYDDPIRDLEGVNARAQVDAVWNQSSAGARIKDS